jgi:Thiolase, N-terminal domain
LETNTLREAVIVSTARTPLTKSHRGELNITPGATLASFAVKAAVQRAGIDPGLIEDAILGCGYPEGTTGRNIARIGPAGHCHGCQPHHRGRRPGHDRRWGGKHLGHQDA